MDEPFVLRGKRNAALDLVVLPRGTWLDWYSSDRTFLEVLGLKKDELAQLEKKRDIFMDKAQIIQLLGKERSRLFMKWQEGLKQRSSPIVMRRSRHNISGVCLAALCLGCHHLVGQGKVTRWHASNRMEVDQ